jgi:hypothetical protein
MTINYTTNLALAQPVTGTESGTWGDDVNNGITAYLDIAIAGGLAVTVTTADVTLTNTQGSSSGTNISSSTAQYAILNVSGAMTGARNLIVPSSSKWYVINNSTTGGYALTVKGSATTGVSLVNGERALIAWNGSDYVKIANSSGPGVFTTLSATALTATADSTFSSTGALAISKGTTAQQPASPITGMLRYNTTTNLFEGYSGSSPTWASVGGGATGGATDQVFWQNGQTINASYSITSGSNAGTFGPVTVASGASFTGATSGISTSLTTSSVTGTILVGQTISGTNITAGTVITAFVSGVSGGAGVYTISPASTGTVSGTVTSSTIVTVPTGSTWSIV